MIFANNIGGFDTLSISGFEAPVGFHTLRIFTAGYKGNHYDIGAVTAFSSRSSTTSTTSRDYATSLGTFDEPEDGWKRQGYDEANDPSGSTRYYFDLPVAAPAGTRSLLLKFAPRIGGVRVYEVQALTDGAPSPRRRGDHAATAGIRLSGSPAGLPQSKVEEGIGMQPNALVTFDLDEIRAAGGLDGRALEFVCERSGVNDSALSPTGEGDGVHMAVIVSTRAGVLSATLDGVQIDVANKSGAWQVRSKIGKPLVAGGRFAAWRVPVAAEAKYLTLVSTRAGDRNGADHAVWVGAIGGCPINSTELCEQSEPWLKPLSLMLRFHV